MIRVLIAEDSNVIKKILKEQLEKESEIKIIDFASNGQEACQKTFKLKPDIILMDINMPFCNGFDATKSIMEKQPTPVIMITSESKSEEILSKSIKSGAIALFHKPRGFDYSLIVKKIVTEIKKYSRFIIKTDFIEEKEEQKELNDKKFIPEIICIGSSTGGPDALSKVLSAIEIKLEIPLIIVQHITAGFNKDLVKWLQPVTKMHVKIAENGEKLAPGVIYMPDDNSHLIIRKDKSCHNTTENLHPFICPSVDVTFKSVAKVFKENTLGVILTGMGKDGAEGMAEIYKNNGYTIAQDRESSVIFGMPKASIEKNIVKSILSIDNIGKRILEIYLSAYGR